MGTTHKVSPGFQSNMSPPLDSDDEAAKQLQTELETVISKTIDASSHRPVLKRLNADSSWLLSLPYPRNFHPPSGRCRYNIVIDPWLHGPQSDIHQWFSTQWHAIEPDVQSVYQLNTLLRDAEEYAIRKEKGIRPQKDFKSPSSTPFIDAVICSHEFTDHCHEATLKQIDPSVPIFGPSKAARLVKSWNYFVSVNEVPTLEQEFDWRTSSHSPLPSFIGLARMQTPDEVYAKLHTVFLIFLNLDETSEAETIMYTPHGIEATHLQCISWAEPPVKTLALLHGLNYVTIAGSQLNLGIENAIPLQRLLKSRYWIPTHDEIKIARGLISPLLRSKRNSIERTQGVQIIAANSRPEEAFVHLENGQCLILEC